MIALLLALLTAHAADPVLHAGQPAEAASKAARDAKVDPSTLTPSTPSQLFRGRPPVLQGEGTLTVCSKTPTTRDAVEEALIAAEKSLNFMEYGAALNDLDTAEQLIGCLDSPVDPARASRMYYLRGVALDFSGLDPAAESAWVQAHRFEPGLQWDDAYPPDGKPAFEAARAKAEADAPVTLTLVPPDMLVWIDGRQTRIDDSVIRFPGGDHLIQLGGDTVSTVRLSIDPGAEASLLIPQAIPDDAVAWVADAARRPQLSAVLAATLGQGAVVYVVHDGTTWRGTAGGEWQALEAVPAPRDNASATKPKRTWYLALTGAGVAVTSGTLSLLTAGAANTEYDLLTSPASPDFPDSASEWQDGKDRYTRLRTASTVTAWVAVAGAAVGVTGLFVPLGDNVRLSPTGQGIRLDIRR